MQNGARRPNLARPPRPPGSFKGRPQQRHAPNAPAPSRGTRKARKETTSTTWSSRARNPLAATPWGRRTTINMPSTISER
jgi:hypothetical protein